MKERAGNQIETIRASAIPVTMDWWQLSVTYWENPDRKAGAHRDLYAPKRIFSCNTALKSHGRRQPCHGFFSCLAEKPFVLECFAVLKSRFFLTGNARGRSNTLCIARTMDFLWGKRFFQNRVNPYVSPPRAAHIFYFCDNCTITTVASSLVR